LILLQTPHLEGYADVENWSEFEGDDDDEEEVDDDGYVVCDDDDEGEEESPCKFPRS